jgi:hypothetical protein
MNGMRKHAMLTVAMVLLGSFIWSMAAIPSPTPKTKGWEYAEFSQSATDEDFAVKWPSPWLRDTTLAGLYTKVAGRPFQKSADKANCTWFDILNALGSQGWELVQELPADRFHNKRYLFKRSVN